MVAIDMRGVVLGLNDTMSVVVKTLTVRMILTTLLKKHPS